MKEFDFQLSKKSCWSKTVQRLHCPLWSVITEEEVLLSLTTFCLVDQRVAGPLAHSAVPILPALKPLVCPGPSPAPGPFEILPPTEGAKSEGRSYERNKGHRYERSKDSTSSSWHRY